MTGSPRVESYQHRRRVILDAAAERSSLRPGQRLELALTTRGPLGEAKGSPWAARTSPATTPSPSFAGIRSHEQETPRRRSGASGSHRNVRWAASQRSPAHGASPTADGGAVGLVVRTAPGYSQIMTGTRNDTAETPHDGDKEPGGPRGPRQLVVPDSDAGLPTGEKQAAINREDDPPA